MDYFEGGQQVTGLLGPYALYIKAAVILFLVSSAGIYGYHQGSTGMQAKWDATVLARKDGEEAALKAAARAIARIEVKSEKHIQPVVTEIRTNTVYRDCSHSDGVMRNINALITGESPDNGDVPEAKPTE